MISKLIQFLDLLATYYSDDPDLVANISCEKTCSTNHVLYFLMKEVQELFLKITKM